jgi:ankyrin repeat protein
MEIIIKKIIDENQDASNYRSEFNNIYSNIDHVESRKSIEDILSSRENLQIDFFNILDDKLAAIRLACLEDLFQTIKYFDKNGADFHQLDWSKTNCIHWASEGGSLRILDFMIEKNVNLFQRNYFGDSGLILAAEKNHKKIIEKLLDCGLDVNYLDECKRTPLIFASTEGYKEIVEYLVQNKADIHLRTETDNRTALHFACRGGHREVVEFLIQNGANIHELDSYNMSCLHFAAFTGNIELFDLLINHGNYNLF